MLRGRHEQPVVGPDEQTVPAPHRDAAARPADAGIDDRDVHPGGVNGSARRRASAPERMAWRGTPWVRSMTRASGAIRAMTPWHTPTYSSWRP